MKSAGRAYYLVEQALTILNGYITVSTSDLGGLSVYDRHSEKRRIIDEHQYVYLLLRMTIRVAEINKTIH